MANAKMNQGKSRRCDVAKIRQIQLKADGITENQQMEQNG